MIEVGLNHFLIVSTFLFSMGIYGIVTEGVKRCLKVIFIPMKIVKSAVYIFPKYSFIIIVQSIRLL